MTRPTKLFLIVLIIIAFSSGIANVIYAILAPTPKPDYFLALGVFSFFLAHLMNYEVCLHEKPREEEIDIDETF